MRNTIFSLTFILNLTFLPVSIYAQNKINNSALIKECETLIMQKMESDKITGVSAAVIMEGSVIWEKGFGYADKENKVPMTENTVVNVASVTKTFTALAIMKLYEMGIIDINQPLNK